MLKNLYLKSSSSKLRKTKTIMTLLVIYLAVIGLTINDIYLNSQMYLWNLTPLF